MVQEQSSTAILCLRLMLSCSQMQKFFWYSAVQDLSHRRNSFSIGRGRRYGVSYLVQDLAFHDRLTRRPAIDIGERLVRDGETGGGIKPRYGVYPLVRRAVSPGIGLLAGDRVTFDVLIDACVAVRARRTRWNVMEGFGIFHPVLRAQFSVVR